MSEWWTYRLSDFLMYTPRSFERLLEAYNMWLFPGQAVALAAGAGLVWVAWRGHEREWRAALILLGVSWFWIAWAFFHARLSTIDLAAPYYAYGFAFQGMLLLWLGWTFRQGKYPLVPRSRLFNTIVIFIAVFVLPLVAPFLGGSWKAIALFGLTPDATALATLSMVVILPGAGRWLGAMVPLLWCVISAALLWNFGQPHAALLPLLAFITLVQGLWTASKYRTMR